MFHIILILLHISFLQRLHLKLTWGGKEVEEEISYLDLHHKNKENLNEYVKELSKKLIEKHFSGTPITYIYIYICI